MRLQECYVVARIERERAEGEAATVGLQYPRRYSKAGTVHDRNCGGWGCEGGWRPAGGLAHGRARGKGFPS